MTRIGPLPIDLSSFRDSRAGDYRHSCTPVSRADTTAARKPMNFKHSLPSELYRQAVTAHPYRFRSPRKAGAGEVSIDGQWQLLIHPSCGELTRLAGKEFLQFMRD